MRVRFQRRLRSNQHVLLCKLLSGTCPLFPTVGSHFWRALAYYERTRASCHGGYVQYVRLSHEKGLAWPKSFPAKTLTRRAFFRFQSVSVLLFETHPATGMDSQFWPFRFVCFRHQRVLSRSHPIITYIHRDLAGPDYLIEECRSTNSQARPTPSPFLLLNRAEQGGKRRRFASVLSRSEQYRYHLACC